MANKYGNKKIFKYDTKFDSKLELFLYELLESYEIDFEFQVNIELIPTHKINGETVKKTFMKVDFVIKRDDLVMYIDTKGYPTDVSKLKYKMLGFKKLNEGAVFEIIWLKNKKEVIEFINKLTKK